MAADLIVTATAMARREAAALLLPAPFVPTDGIGTLVTVRPLPCPACGARDERRRWTVPFAAEDTAREAPGPTLSMLACETLTARAVLPIVVTVERVPELREARFQTRAAHWTALAPEAGPDHEKALAEIDASERWIDAPEDFSGEWTLPASTRLCRPASGWRQHRADLAPHFLSPHRDLPPRVDRHYAAVRRSALRDAYREPPPGHARPGR
ncbi:hypothetical protein ACH35V_05530 [Actinomadura sp. 1N219]|uniref:hypothetical protein n=1 Tax=Actinomadura sp. 1N219 TaxID=3375152 RepID=UPI0037947F9F